MSKIKKLLSVLIAILMISGTVPVAFASSDDTVSTSVELDYDFLELYDDFRVLDSEDPHLVVTVGAIVVPPGCSVAIDLSGCTLRIVASIQVFGELYIDNSGTIKVLNPESSAIQVMGEGKVVLREGRISGGDCGVELNEKGSFIMNGGTITGNNYGVSMKSGTGNFVMNGGTITGNDCGVDLSFASGDFIMNGGRITGNGYGVSFPLDSGADFSLGNSYTMTARYSPKELVIKGSSIVIKGNTHADVYLHQGQTIAFDAKPYSGSDIGITSYSMHSDPADNHIAITGTNAADYSQYFHSDNSDYWIVNEDNVLYLNKCRIFTLDAAGGSFEEGAESTITTVKRNYNEKIGEIPVPVRQGYTFNGYYLTEDTDHTDKVVPDSEKLTEDTIMKENLTWYASWSINTYKVTYSYLTYSGKREYPEYFYKYGEEYSAPEIPTVFFVGDTKYTFKGWSPEFTGTHVMSDENAYYEAKYDIVIDYPADYTELDEAVAKAKEIMQDEEYTARYTEDSRNSLETAFSAVENGLLISKQDIVDEYLKNLNTAMEGMVKNKHSVAFVVFVDNVGEEILSVEVDYGSKVEVPVMPSVKACDETEHYILQGWDKSTDGCGYVTEDMQFNASYIREAHSFTAYNIDTQTSSENSKTLVSQCDMGCGAIDTVTIVSSAGKHADENGDGVCDNGGEQIKPDEPSDTDCSHLCHSDNAFMQLIWKFISFLFRLFNIQQYCDCGALHY